MNHCIIGVKENNEYLAVLCVHQGQLLNLLQEHFNTLREASELVNLGDINSISERDVNAFHRDWGISWRYTKTQFYKDKSSLYQYCETAGIEQLFLFEDQQWQVITFEYTFEYDKRLSQKDCAA